MGLPMSLNALISGDNVPNDVWAKIEEF